MALIKSKVGNTTYSWKSDDVRDTEIASLSNSITSVSNSLNDYKAHMKGLDGVSVQISNTKWNKIFEINYDLNYGLSYGYYAAILSVPVSYLQVALIEVITGSTPTGISIERSNCKKMLMEAGATSTHILIGAKVLSSAKIIFLQKSAYTNFTSNAVKLGDTSETVAIQGHTSFDYTNYQDSDLDAIYDLN